MVHFRQALAIIALALLFTPLAHASGWSWENYKGTTQWSVDVAEDDTACNGGGAPTHETVPVTITHNYFSATVSDWAHGPATGQFHGFILSIPGKTIDDPPGSSVLDPFDIAFTNDCLSFWGQYAWHYTDSGGSCDGSTQITGTRTDGTTCPGQPPTPTGTPTQTPQQLSQAINDAHVIVANERDLRAQINVLDRAILNDDPDSPSYDLNTYDRQKLRDKFEAQYEASKAVYEQILARDPANYWANLDMSELERLQGNSHGYFDYFGRAANNKNVFEHTAEVVEQQAATELGFKEFPTPGQSKIVSQIQTDLKKNEPVATTNPFIPQKDYWTEFKTAFYNWIHPKTYDSIYELGGTPAVK